MRKDYINLSHKPTRKEFVAEYYLEPAQGYSIERVANAVAGESSIDTWSDIKTLSPAIVKRLKPSVFHINKRQGIVKIAYSAELFEPGSISQLLSSLAGNILSMKMVANIKLLDVTLPKEYVESFKGPLYGIKGIRQVLKIKNRPLLGTIVKPKLGLKPGEHALVAYRAWVGGIDLVKDDENLTNQCFNPFKARVRAVLKLRKKAEKVTGKRKAYMPNITAPTTEELLARARFVKGLGCEYAMVDIITTGWTALQSLREYNQKLKLILHGHRCMHSAFTRNPKHGVAMLVVAKLTRLIGLDQLHIGTVIGKMEGTKREVLDIEHEMEAPSIGEMPLHHVLSQKWWHIKPLMPVASGGLQPLMIPQLYKYFGNDIVLQFGGGIHAHPSGTESGARAVYQALEATLKGIPLKTHAKTHRELAEAFKKWG